MGFFKYLPAYELNHSPKIIAAFEMDFLRNLFLFQKSLRKDEKFTLILQLGWSVEIPEVADELKILIATAREAFPESHIIIFANSLKEVEIIKEFAEVYLAQHNIFLDPKRYPLAKKTKRKYHAIYIARITPFKRHLLAEKVHNLHLIGTYSENEREYFESTIKHFGHAQWNRKVPSFLIGRKICEARCGLALSAVEGAMFACGEYTLCGIPVVNTQNLGGRDTLLPRFATRMTDDNPDAVAEAVEFWSNNPIEPQEIRAEFLKLASPQKEMVQDLIDTIAGRRVYLPHKLNVRCNLLPWQKWLHGIRQK